VGDSRHAVQGSAWMDHEFSTAPLQPGITGWDWFSLQLADRTEVMMYMLRQPDGTFNPASSGTVVLPSGQTQHLLLSDVKRIAAVFLDQPAHRCALPGRMAAAGRFRCSWISPWRPTWKTRKCIPRNSTNVVYWEGSVKVEGTRNGKSDRWCRLCGNDRICPRLLMHPCK
jgi:predicted secreted hydrolase